MANSRYFGLVQVVSELKNGYWVVTSKDMPGLLLCGKTLKELMQDIPAAIKLLFKHNYDMDIEVVPVGDPQLLAQEKELDVIPDNWVAYKPQECCA